MKAILAGVVATVIIAFFFYMSGIDFTKRGESTGGAYMMCALAFVIGWGARKHYEIGPR